MAKALEISANHGLDDELLFQIGAHLVLHLVDLPKGEHALTNDTPGFVGICVIADDLGSDREREDEEAVPGGTACGGEPVQQRSSRA